MRDYFDDSFLGIPVNGIMEESTAEVSDLVLGFFSFDSFAYLLQVRYILPMVISILANGKMLEDMEWVFIFTGEIELLLFCFFLMFFVSSDGDRYEGEWRNDERVSSLSIVL
jgi:hypothetical protein